jgi:heat shock protein HslJ
MIRHALLAALPLLTACASPGAVKAPPEAGSDRPLTTWTFVAIDGQPPRSDKAELRIYEGRIGATVGCNGLGGDLKMVPGQLQVGPIISTQMYCEGLMEQERIVAELLGASPAFFIENGRMGIRSDKHVAELMRKID